MKMLLQYSNKITTSSHMCIYIYISKLFSLNSNTISQNEEEEVAYLWREAKPLDHSQREEVFLSTTAAVNVAASRFQNEDKPRKKEREKRRKD